MRREILLTYLLANFLLVSCSDETTIFIDEQRQSIVEENDPITLSGSVTFENAGVLDISIDQNFSGKRVSKALEEPAGNYPMTMIGQVLPPTFGPVTSLTAAHVYVEDDFAYVAYNTAGEDYSGAIDIVDVTDPNNPKITSRLVYTNADINSLQYHQGFLYAVGGLDATASFTASSNSFITKIPVFNGVMDTNAGIIYGFQPGDNATDIVVEKNEAFVTSGKNGSVTIYDTKDLTIKKEEAYTDLRSLALFDNRLALLDADLGIRILDDNLKPKMEIPVDSDFGLYTKRTVDFDGDKIIVAEGAKGAGVYSYDSGTLLQYIPIITDPLQPPTGDIVNNAVAINGEMVLMANGGAGLSISNDEGDTKKPYGVIQLGGSINYVQTKGDYAFAASGQEGLQILKLNRLSLSLAAQCATLPDYKGSAKLVVNRGENAGFSGAKSFNSISVEGSLILCGSWTVRNDLDIKDDALMEMNGSLSVGSNKKEKEIKVEKGATLRIEGNLIIYGDLDLEDNSTLEFIGNNSVVNIFGEVKMGDNVNVVGNFTDVRNKL
ncbi:Uncharacterized conserved protein [Muriicola jejuensis]|uniref:LVIVD repeat-containing protein n=1 Tax=Muriicola jejuensis TaxID=504488 RepID=A0A6P0UM72_9FLAO|nr:hypothetical protein [Muriicola jejuensis]NER11356.1 hypothetical protein [Muriicola jejuensis]SMP21184.1 Uncharacterized conserved protein [Muriicola jejuensis]